VGLSFVSLSIVEKATGIQGNSYRDTGIWGIYLPTNGRALFVLCYGAVGLRRKLKKFGMQEQKQEPRISKNPVFVSRVGCVI
jgi:hypothetical protein